MSNYYANHENALNEARNVISQRNTDDLNKLINNEEDMTRMIANLHEIQQMETVKESLKENIRRLAISNLDKEPTLHEEKQKLAELYDELNRTREEYNQIRQQYDELTGESNPEMIWVLLQTAASEQERSTEQKADDFFYGEKSEEEVTEFERRFIDERKRAHELKIKADKFNELLQMSQSTAYLNPHRSPHTGGYH